MNDIKPLEFDILKLDANMLQMIPEIKSKDIHENNTTIFKEDGLFSTTIFGEMGTPERLKRFGYIDLSIKIFHPLVYNLLCKISSKYKKILEGKIYVKFDEKINNFIEVEKEDGQNGILYFIKYYDKLKHEETDSTERKNIIKFLYNHKRSDVLINKFLVIPAGLRDYTVTKSGKPMEDEINALYRKLLTVTNVTKQFIDEPEGDLFINSIILRLQRNVVIIYDYIENILTGKKGFIQGNWTSRTTAYGTRNVLTALPIKIDDLTKEDTPDFNDTILGPFQAFKANLPITIYQTYTTFINILFDREANQAYLINKKSLKKESVELSDKSRSKWVTDEGLEGIINKLGDDDFKVKPIEADDHYLFLVYDNGKEIIILDDIDMLPEGKDKKFVRAITYIELFYIAVYPVIDQFRGFTTRFPITGHGSIYPTEIYVKTTNKTRRVNVSGKGLSQPMIINEYPILDKSFFNSMAVHYSHLPTLNADMDGDKLNVKNVWEEESKEDINKLLNSRAFYISMEDKIIYSADNDISRLLMTELT